MSQETKESESEGRRGDACCVSEGRGSEGRVNGRGKRKRREGINDCLMTVMGWSREHKGIQGGK